MVSAVGFGVGAVAAGAAILRFEADNALQNGPSYIKDGIPTSAPAQIGQAIARQACRRYADGVDSLLDEATVNFETVCRPYLDNIGYGSGPTLKKPFDGGQCPGKYRVNYTARTPTSVQGGTNCVGLNIVNAFVDVWGPVGGIVDRVPGCLTGDEGPAPFKGIVCHGPASQVRQTESVVQGIIGRAYSASITSIAPLESNPDNCGDPPPVITPPVPPPNPGPPTEPFNPNPGIDIDITVEVKPDALIEVNLGFGPIIIAPFGGGDGGGEPGGDPDTSPPAPEPGPETPGGGGGAGGDDMFGEPPAGRRWVGCCITITATPDNAGVIATSEPEDVYPSVIGNIRLVCNAAGNRLTDTPVRILAKHVCVWEPVQKLNPTGVNVDLLPGYTYSYRPYSVPSGD